MWVDGCVLRSCSVSVVGCELALLSACFHLYFFLLPFTISFATSGVRDEGIGASSSAGLAPSTPRL